MPTEKSQSQAPVFSLPLQETGGNRTRAAEILGIGLRTLQRKLRDYEQAPEDVPAPQGQTAED